MRLFRACDCYSTYCEHNPMPFSKLGPVATFFWSMLNGKKWFRMFLGGTWQKFEVEKDYFRWHKVDSKISSAIETEEH
jgi:hypothetical protein